MYYSSLSRRSIRICEHFSTGMRYDSAFASIYDDSGLEIENAELLFMDQGVLVFRAYSNGHPYDTSQVLILYELMIAIVIHLIPYNSRMPKIFIAYSHCIILGWRCVHLGIASEAIAMGKQLVHSHRIINIKRH